MTGWFCRGTVKISLSTLFPSCLRASHPSWVTYMLEVLHAVYDCEALPIEGRAGVA